MNTYNNIFLVKYDKKFYCKRIIPKNCIKSDTCLVFLHEGLGSISQWKSFPDDLCKITGMPGLVYDRDGYGKSDKILDNFDESFFHFQAELLDSILENLNIKRVILVGHSDGGTIALFYGKHYPNTVISSILIASHVINEPKIINGINLLNNNKENIIHKLKKYHYNPTLVYNRWYNFWINSSLIDWDITKLLENYTPNTLIIQGENDEYSSEIQYKILAKLIDKNELSLIANCGHSPFIIHKTQLIKICSTFIQKFT